MKNRTEIKSELYALVYDYENNRDASYMVKHSLAKRIKTCIKILNGECDEELVNRAIRLGILI